MPKRRLRKSSATSAQCIASGDGDLLKEMCPCRNRVLDTDAWREVFAALYSGDRKQRRRAAHAVATLLQKAQESQKWRTVLQHFSAEIEAAERDPVVYSALVAQVGHQAGHARTLKGDATNTFRRQRRVLDLSSAAELANWLNGELGLEKHRGVSRNHPGVDRLWRWLLHRTEFQNRRRVSTDELRAKARQWLPEHFERLRSAG